MITLTSKKHIASLIKATRYAFKRAYTIGMESYLEKEIRAAINDMANFEVDESNLLGMVTKAGIDLNGDDPGPGYSIETRVAMFNDLGDRLETILDPPTVKVGDFVSFSRYVSGFVRRVHSDQVAVQVLETEYSVSKVDIDNIIQSQLTGR